MEFLGILFRVSLQKLVQEKIKRIAFDKRQLKKLFHLEQIKFLRIRPPIPVF